MHVKKCVENFVNWLVNEFKNQYTISKTTAVSYLETKLCNAEELDKK